MNYRAAGFTVVELIITMAIVAILLTLGVVNLRSSEVSGRDADRKGDVSNTALFLETIYTNGTESQPSARGSYPPTSAVANSSNVDDWFAGFELKNLRAPGVDTSSLSITPATNAVQTISGVTPQPTTSTYVYQPIDGTGALCTTAGSCRKFTIYYLPEANGSIVQMVKSRNQ